MIEHYNAFISYKHAPLDTRVATEIQTRLERFRIPKAIQKSSGVKKIHRIFRDKEELNFPLHPNGLLCGMGAEMTMRKSALTLPGKRKSSL